MLEALGDESASRRLAELFFLCFKTYTRSIQLWMETGQVDPSDITFFVRANRENDLRTLWHDWFVLDEGPGQQKIPQFLETSVRKIFTAGKSMVFLRHLNALLPETREKPDMTLDEISSADSSLLLPFSALVESAFEKFVDVDHSLSAIRLREELDEKCGLWSSLDALQHVYLGKDMSALSVIYAKVFELIDRGRSWDDRFLLTEISRTAFSSIAAIDPSRLLVRPARNTPRESQDRRSVAILESISVDYGLPWPVANIINEEAMGSYQRISTFLMQIRRARYTIIKQRIRDARNMQGEKDDTLVHALHHNMLWFIDFIYGHLTYLVISTATQSLHSALVETKDVDSMIAAHKSYMSSLEAQCLLSENLSPIHEAIISLLDLCVHFADLQTAHLSGASNNKEDGDDFSMEAAEIRPTTEDEFDSDDDDDDMGHEHTLTISFHDSTYHQQLRKVKVQFDHLATSVADGLKGIARADGLPSWDILAERLEWCRR
jgi:gamma-tubulin complex component 5